jgi:hypothetical protein
VHTAPAEAIPLFYDRTRFCSSHAERGRAARLADHFSPPSKRKAPRVWPARQLTDFSPIRGSIFSCRNRSTLHRCHEHERQKNQTKRLAPGAEKRSREYASVQLRLDTMVDAVEHAVLPQPRARLQGRWPLLWPRSRSRARSNSRFFHWSLPVSNFSPIPRTEANTAFTGIPAIPGSIQIKIEVERAIQSGAVDDRPSDQIAVTFGQQRHGSVQTPKARSGAARWSYPRVVLLVLDVV